MLFVSLSHPSSSSLISPSSPPPCATLPFSSLSLSTWSFPSEDKPILSFYCPSVSLFLCVQHRLFLNHSSLSLTFSLGRLSHEPILLSLSLCHILPPLSPLPFSYVCPLCIPIVQFLILVNNFSSNSKATTVCHIYVHGTRSYFLYPLTNSTSASCFAHSFPLE